VTGLLRAGRGRSRAVPPHRRYHPLQLKRGGECCCCCCCSERC
jgi:hypothetical protein